ncbi:hypothetical protein CXB51_008379 [Gossypium anomalum]|uniref:Anaphase-promoting complex subunit 4-like WD40 domain-containing protein n=1 Tax=Gossypium anomalum TaxID=47600 RepID=A0A8J6DAI4_9ROSI|nr:hypothetical protein CXB51_008379 [Gossypium anomalum]
MQIRNKVLDSCKEFFKNRVRDEENDDGDDNDFDEEEEEEKNEVCVGLVHHCMSILKTKCKTSNRAFGLVVCKVLGWDIDRLPVILLKGEPLSRILANSSELQNTLQGEGSNKNVENLETGNSSGKIQKDASDSLLDRFIPNRSAMDYDYAHYMLTEWRKINENQTNKPPTPVELFPSDHTTSCAHLEKPSKPLRHIPQTLMHCDHHLVLQSSESTLDAPDLMDDFYLNLLDWGSSNIDDDNGSVTSVSWAPDGRHIAIGLNNSEVQLWDSASNRQLHTLRGCHRSRVGSMAWNNHFLTTGGMDGMIVNNDRTLARSLWAEMVSFWTTTGQWRHDNLVHIWDMSKASSNSPTQWIHRLEYYTYGIWDMSKAQELAKEKADIAIKSLQCLPQSLQIIHLSEKK